MKHSVISVLAALLLTACSNIDCPLSNGARLECGLYSAETGTVLTLFGTELTITAAGTDSILLNRLSNSDKFSLPLAYRTGTDTLLLHFSGNGGQFATDTLLVEHTAQPHFENVDCPAVVFHTLQTISHTSHPLRELPLTVDSVVVSRSIVDYEDLENLRIYLRAVATE